MPMQNGSCGSSTSSASAFTKAEPLNARIDLSISNRDPTFKDAADDALLLPYLALAESSVGIKTGQLCAGSGAAWRTIVGLAGTENKILAVD